MDATLLRQNIESCLLGAADDGYTNQLNHLSRVGLRSEANGVKEWCDALESRFRDSPGKSLTLLESIRYTVQDVRKAPDGLAVVYTNSLNWFSNCLNRFRTGSEPVQPSNQPFKPLVFEAIAGIPIND